MGALVYILRRMQATQPDACVLRPALREEARKAIGALLLARAVRGRPTAQALLCLSPDVHVTQDLNIPFIRSILT